jgi:NAD(P)-dependent dehydrogenase (short-subunit alcohol dehydrogenase family)
MSTGILTGKTAIVTGSSSGIGKAIAERFGREGATVYVVADKNVVGGEETAATIRDAGGAATFTQCDVSDPEQFKALIDRAADETGRLDILVNNAGTGAGRKAEGTTVEDFNRVLSVNLAGPFYGAKFAIPHMRAQGGGAIINVSSVYGLIGAPGVTAYAASKGGLIMMTKQMAVDYAHENIRINCICPGFVDTDLGGRRAAMAPEERAVAQARREERAALQPIGRQAQPVEMAGLALYLASEEASFMHGSIIAADGGESILHNWGEYRD